MEKEEKLEKLPEEMKEVLKDAVNPFPTESLYNSVVTTARRLKNHPAERMVWSFLEELQFLPTYERQHHQLLFKLGCLYQRYYHQIKDYDQKEWLKDIWKPNKGELAIEVIGAGISGRTTLLTTLTDFLIELGYTVKSSPIEAKREHTIVINYQQMEDFRERIIKLEKEAEGMTDQEKEEHYRINLMPDFSVGIVPTTKEEIKKFREEEESGRNT